MFTLALALAACSTEQHAWSGDTEKRWKQHREQGRSLFQSGRFEEAQKEFEEALDTVLAKKQAATTWDPVSDKYLDALAAAQSLNDLAETYTKEGTHQKGSALSKNSLNLSTSALEGMKASNQTATPLYQALLVEEIRSLDQMALSSSSLGYYSEAESFLSKAIALKKELSDPSQCPVPLQERLDDTKARHADEETQFSKIGDHVPERKQHKHRKKKHDQPEVEE